MARECFDNYVQLNYTCWLYKARQEAKKLAKVDTLTRSCARFPPIYLSAEVWSEMIEIWLKEDWKKRSEKASENRTNNPDYMPYTGGSCSVAATHERMVKKHFFHIFYIYHSNFFEYNNQNEEAGYEVGHCEVYKKTHSLAKTNDWAHPKGGCFIVRKFVRNASC